MLKVNLIVVEHSSEKPMLLPWLRIETDVENYSSTLYVQDRSRRLDRLPDRLSTGTFLTRAERSNSHCNGRVLVQQRQSSFMIDPFRHAYNVRYGKNGC